jgi:hypothetical protein
MLAKMGSSERRVGTVRYTAWDKDGVEFTLIKGDQLPACDTVGMQLLKVFEAESWEDACRQYHEWQGWEPYRPMDEA